MIVRQLSRSFLFVPGDKPGLFAKAHRYPAGEIIIDLEDAVAPADKPVARNTLAGSLPHSRPVLIRINGSNTDWFHGDLEVCKLPGVSGVIVPKSESADDIRQVADRINPGSAIFPIIEVAALSSGSATKVDGKMVDQPVISRAELILTNARTASLDV